MCYEGCHDCWEKKDRTENCLSKHKMESDLLSFSGRVGFSVSSVLFLLLFFFKENLTLHFLNKPFCCFFFSFFFVWTIIQCLFPSALPTKAIYLKIYNKTKGLLFSSGKKIDISVVIIILKFNTLINYYEI